MREELFGGANSLGKKGEEGRERRGSGDGTIQKRKGSDISLLSSTKGGYCQAHDSAVPLLRVSPMEFVPLMPGNVNRKSRAWFVTVLETTHMPINNRRDKLWNIIAY